MSLRYGVLGLLKEEPLHGYEVKNRFEAMLGGTWEVNVGQIYMTLQRLERDGLVRPVGARGDRGKQTYELSPDGRKALDQWLGQPDSGPQQMRGAVAEAPFGAHPGGMFARDLPVDSYGEDVEFWIGCRTAARADFAAGHAARVAISDLNAGAFGAIGVLAALQSRHATGRGQHVESSLLEAALASND